MLAHQVKRERKGHQGMIAPPRGSPQLVLPSGRHSLFVLRRVSFPYSSWVSRAGAGAAGFPRPEGQTYHSRTRPSPRLDKGGASRESTTASSLSELCSRRHSPPSSLKRNAAAAQRRPALVPPYRRRAGTQATQTTQAVAPSARSRFQSARWSTSRCMGEVGTASPPRWTSHFGNGQKYRTQNL